MHLSSKAKAAALDASDAVVVVPADDATLAAEALLVAADEEAATLALSAEEAALDAGAAALSDEDASLDVDSVDAAALDADEVLPDAFDDELADELQAQSPITKTAKTEQRNTTMERFMATSPSNWQTG